MASGIPYPGVNVSAAWGSPVAYGVLHAAPGRLIALTQVIWNGDPVVDGADGPQQPTSLLAFSSSDGYHWQFAAVLQNASWSPGGMGPSSRRQNCHLMACTPCIFIWCFNSYKQGCRQNDSLADG